ncbi:DNA polymerase III subunit chi [Paroceanicella profunda]|uniref:DNA polymerase III subunit chi n=1 Tax=Paroceanicella profunda TaxID=2579971 RepID=A0A5B8FHZ2_9RHOB|nr:DNA polymerase III subunit chi [Paroceanicella profunda]QDL92508.1 DNA polymerase III subunit chi [Paroceanicella profunda]
MAEVLFYHLTGSPLEATLPGLLERTLERGWRAVVRCGVAERVPALDGLLWSYSEAGFLPHGTEGPHAERQPVYLTAGAEMPNGAEVLFLVDGAQAATEEISALTRTVLLFDGADGGAVARAREDWKRVAGAGLQATYWAQEDGRWLRKASSGAQG